MWRVLRLGRPLQLSVLIIILAGQLPNGAAADDVYADKRNKIAAIIGIATYQHAPPLKNPLVDAALVAKKLEDAGFTVDTINDAPLAALTPALQAFMDKAKGADIALVYYAGHAVQIDGENYMVPVDFDTATADIFGGLYPVKTLLEGLNTAAKARVLLLDACRDNPFQERLKDLLGARASGQGLAAIQMPVIDGRALPQGTQGLVVGYATQPGSVARDGKGDNGPYAASLVAALSDPDRDVNRILTQTTGAVIAATKGRQQPEHRMALTGPLYLVSRQKPFQCDVLAAEPDNDVSVAGIDFEEIDVAKALPACEADYAKNANSPRLMHNYAKTLERSGKLAEAVALYRKSAERGYDWAQVYLATAYMEGTGVAADMAEGVAWLRKSFEQGNRQALITYTELDLSRAFDNKPWRVKILQQALRDAGDASVQDSDAMDDATSTALSSFIAAQGIENKTITFQVLDRLGIIEAMFPKKEAPKPE